MGPSKRIVLTESRIEMDPKVSLAKEDALEVRRPTCEIVVPAELTIIKEPPSPRSSSIEITDPVLLPASRVRELELEKTLPKEIGAETPAGPKVVRIMELEFKVIPISTLPLMILLEAILIGAP